MAGMIESPEELEMCLDQLSLSTRELIFLPINDAQDPSIVGGGSHWSLMVFHRASNSFFYFDSVSTESHNGPYAEKCAKNLYPALHVASDEKYQFLPVASSKQTNGFDCGLYTVSNAEIACKCILEHGLTKPIPKETLEKASNAVTAESVKAKRAELHTTICGLAQKLQK